MNMRLARTGARAPRSTGRSGRPRLGRRPRHADRDGAARPGPLVGDGHRRLLRPRLRVARPGPGVADTGSGRRVVAGMASLSVADRASMFESLGMTPDIARAVAEANDETMGRCILSLYRSAAQPAMARLGAGPRCRRRPSRPGDHPDRGPVHRRRSAGPVVGRAGQSRSGRASGPRSLVDDPGSRRRRLRVADVLELPLDPLKGTATGRVRPLRSATTRPVPARTAPTRPQLQSVPVAGGPKEEGTCPSRRSRSSSPVTSRNGPAP